METTSKVHPSNDYTATHLFNPGSNQVIRQHITHPAYIENPTQSNKAITWEHNGSHTHAAQSSVTKQTVSPQPSIFDRMADILRPSLQSIAKTFFNPENDVTSVTHSRPSRSYVPISAVLDDIAKAYPAGTNSPQYQFVLATINSSPMLLRAILSRPTPIRLTDQPSTEINANPSVSQSELDQAYQLSLIPGTSSTLGKAKLLAKLAHEFGRREYEVSNLGLTETFNNRAKAWINSLPSPTQGLNGFNVQLFADDMVTVDLASEAFGAIHAWNTVIDTTKTLDPAQYALIANSTIKTNSDGTIPLTVENVYQRAQIFARDPNYKSQALFDGGRMALLASHARSGDVIRLSGYDANRIMAYGFIQKAGERDTFIKI
jgi:hypothetical protein